METQIDTTVTIDFPRDIANLLIDHMNADNLWQAIIAMKQRLSELETQATKLGRSHKAVVRDMKVKVVIDPPQWEFLLYGSFVNQEDRMVKLSFPEQQDADRFMSALPTELVYRVDVRGYPAIMVWQGKVVNVTDIILELPVELKDKLLLPNNLKMTTAISTAKFEARLLGQSFMLKHDPRPELSTMMARFVVAMDSAIREGRAFDVIQ